MRLLLCVTFYCLILPACRSVAGPPPMVPPIPASLSGWDPALIKEPAVKGRPVACAKAAPPTASPTHAAAAAEPQARPHPLRVKTAEPLFSAKGIRIKKEKGATAAKVVRKKKGAARTKVQSDRAAVQQRVEQAVQRPLNSMSLESKTIFAYIPDAIYLVYAAVNHVVDVQLQPGETLTGHPAAGDTHRWELGTVTEGVGAKSTIHILIKPKMSGIETNFLIVTDKHSYRLYAESSEDFFVPAVGWSYAEDELAQKLQVRKEQQRLEGTVAAPGIIAENLNFKYKVKPEGRYPWTPVRVFDDGSKTYLQASPSMKSDEAPVFFIRDGDSLNLVNYRIRGDFYIVDRLFKEGELRSGTKDRVRIVRETSWFVSDTGPEPGKMGRR